MGDGADGAVVAIHHHAALSFAEACAAARDI